MSIAAIQELIARQSINAELLSHFINFDTAEVTLRLESEYWDYKRDLCNFQDSRAVGELARDVLAFHNTRGGYIICGIANDFTVLGVHDQLAQSIDSGRLNDKLRGYIGPNFHCRYTTIKRAFGGARKTLAIIFVPPRKGTAIPVGRNGPGQPPMFKKGELFLRANDVTKRAESNSELEFLYSPAQPEVIVGSHQLKAIFPRPGFRLFQGDYKEFIGKETREPRVSEAIDELLFGKWDIVLLRGVGGVGKTAVAIEVTHRLEKEYAGHFNGIFSISGKGEELTPYERRGIQPEMVSYEEFMRQFLHSSDWDGDIPETLAEKEKLVRCIIRDKNVLLFIDNYETIETKDSRLADFLKSLPPGAKTLVTSRHQPQTLPALPIDIFPLSRAEAEILATAEASEQRVGAGTVERYLEQILEVSSCIPLAIKWIISCAKSSDHLKQLIEEHRRGRPALGNLCEFCFTFEYNLLAPAAKTVLVLFPIFPHAPSCRELSEAAELDVDVVASALDELVEYSLISREVSLASGEEVYRILELTASFASSKLHLSPDLERKARRRLKKYYGASMPVLFSAAEEMLARHVPSSARQYVNEEILDRDPDNARGYYLRGETFEQELRFKEALQDYQTALAISADREVCTEVALRLIELSKVEPQFSREAALPILERAYKISKDNRLAVEVAKVCAMLDRKEDARRYYERAYSNYSKDTHNFWEDAALFLAQYWKDVEGPQRSLEFVREALSVCPQCKVLVNWERSLALEVGEVRRKRGRLVG